MLVEPPQNGGYMVAAYAITTVILVGYFVALWKKAKKSLTWGRHSERSEESARGTIQQRSRPDVM